MAETQLASDGGGGAASELRVHPGTATPAEYEHRIANLEVALQSNRRIGIAIGILMVRHCQTETDAFEALRVVSQRRNRKLRDIADEVIYTGALPD